MICASKKLQDDIKDMATSLLALKKESEEIYKAYWATDANTKVSALENDTDAATSSTKLTKGNYTNGLSLAEDVEDFFGNEAITQTDYPANCLKIIYSDAATPAKLSEATEQIGARVVQMAQDCLTLRKTCFDILKFYSAHNLDDILGVLSNEDVIPGSSMSKADLNSGITMIEQFKKMMNNEAVTAGDYAATLAKWELY